jgi:hypothetical protein
MITDVTVARFPSDRHHHGPKILPPRCLLPRRSVCPLLHHLHQPPLPHRPRYRPRLFPLPGTEPRCVRPGHLGSESGASLSLSFFNQYTLICERVCAACSWVSGAPSPCSIFETGRFKSICRGYCDYDGVDQVCRHTGHAYSVNYRSNSTSVFVNSSWTRGLAVHPVGKSCHLELLFAG